MSNFASGFAFGGSIFDSNYRMFDYSNHPHTRDRYQTHTSNEQAYEILIKFDSIPPKTFSNVAQRLMDKKLEYTTITTKNVHDEFLLLGYMIDESLLDRVILEVKRAMIMIELPSKVLTQSNKEIDVDHLINLLITKL